MPPSVSRSCFAASIAAFCAAVSFSPPISSTEPATDTPIAPSSAFAAAPAATTTAVWRALARSSALRTSSCPYLSAPARAAGPGQRHGLDPLAGRLALRRPRAHPPRPVRVVAVAHDERERRPERAAVPEPGEHLHLVGLELL